LNAEKSCHYANGFKLWEKVFAQVSFNAMGIVGIVGIALVDWLWAVPYAFVYLYGIPFIVMRHLTCPRCPHLKTYGADHNQTTDKERKKHAFQLG
jgi:hypothetical protein